MEKNLLWQKYFENIETKKVKILNDLRIQKHITNIKKAVCNYDGLYSK